VTTPKREPCFFGGGVDKLRRKLICGWSAPLGRNGYFWQIVGFFKTPRLKKKEFGEPKSDSAQKRKGTAEETKATITKRGEGNHVSSDSQES